NMKALRHAMDLIAAGEADPKMIPEPTPADNLPLVNRQGLMLHVDGDLELLRTMVALFLVEAPESLAAIRAAVESNNTESLFRLAHSLKGMVSNFSSEAVTHAALRLETIAKERDLSNVS